MPGAVYTQLSLFFKSSAVMAALRDYRSALTEGLLTMRLRCILNLMKNVPKHRLVSS
jgi:hypothetical protein